MLKVTRKAVKINPGAFMQENLILMEKHGRVRLLQINRPEAMNALSPELMLQLAKRIESHSFAHPFDSKVFAPTSKQEHVLMKFTAGWRIANAGAVCWVIGKGLNVDTDFCT